MRESSIKALRRRLAQSTTPKKPLATQMATALTHWLRPAARLFLVLAYSASGTVLQKAARRKLAWQPTAFAGDLMAE